MRIVVAAAMIDGWGRVLLQRRPEGKQHGGLWEFPGGKVEAGEGPVQALIREIDEELGVTLSAADITPLSFAHTDDSSGTPPILLLLYVCRLWKGEPVCEKNAMLKWAGRPEISTFPMPPLDVPLAKAVLALLK
ncbi:(deoxy)nucleoside triphosphate pyrophosphohydrolase [Novosphingobium sp. UBA1939]|uniref:(deoxy)nucleoside triphosphate pyrophosphohydrolase n=1 Tax=Novosphingobium sp. UBA1939 TaxID=1946982 RepID=UPI0025DE9348|nr:(deoxy)nucleoside triphosphate pyrophosphohydrolase [Novosphingobium sp. UBA1939]